MVACMMLASAFAGAQEAPTRGWSTEQGVDPPSYAVAEPIDSNLNIDTVVLVCNESGNQRYLNLEIYPSTEGPLLPDGADRRLLKETPGVEIAVDGRVFPAELLFADVYLVVADSREGSAAALSGALLEAMQHGRSMALRFDLLKEAEGQPTFDAELVLDLQAGTTAIASVRRCASVGLHQASR